MRNKLYSTAEYTQIKTPQFKVFCDFWLFIFIFFFDAYKSRTSRIRQQ